MKATSLLASIPLAMALAASAALANASAAQPPKVSPDAPHPVAQFELRGLAPFFDQYARVVAPFMPRQEANALLLKSVLSFPPNLVALVGASSTQPLRAVLYAKPDAGDFGAILDLPAANGDIDAFFAAIALSCTSSPIPPSAAARLPASARMYKVPDGHHFKDSRVLFLPHGSSRVAVWPLDYRGGVSSDQAARLVSGFPAIDADGVLALRFDNEAFDVLAKRNPDAIGAFGNPLRALPHVASVSFGIGLDDASRLRVDTTLSLRPGSPYARFCSSLGSPAPFVNAVLSPDAVAATVQHADRSLVDRAFADELLAHRAAELSNLDIDLSPLSRDLAAILPDIAALVGDDLAVALYPPASGKSLPWALCTSFPRGVQSPADFADRLSALSRSLVSLAKRFLESFPDIDLPDLPLLSVVPRGERTVAGIPILSCALRAAPSGDNPSPRPLLTFDVALAGPALLVSDVPDDRLADILSALAPDAPPRPGIETLPAFASAFGGLPPGASATVVRLVPLLRGLAGKCRELPSAANWGLTDPPFSESLAGIDLPIAAVARHGDSPSILRETISLPIADLHALVSALFRLRF